MFLVAMAAAHASPQPECRKEDVALTTISDGKDILAARISRGVTTRLAIHSIDATSGVLNKPLWDIELSERTSTAPLFVGAPSFNYPGDIAPTPYSEFSHRRRNRSLVVYIGERGGVLHAFDAASGTEAARYIPESEPPAAGVRSATAPLIDSLSMGDVFFGGRWHTVIANAVGAEIHAIEEIGEGNADVTGISVLWKFRDLNDFDSAFTQPVLGKLASGTWAVIFGNAPVADAPSIAKAHGPSLYILDAENGSLLKRIDISAEEGTLPWSIGLSTPAVVDVNGDHVIDYAYAGDSQGNLWKFDLTSSQPEDWNVALQGTPLFRARSTDGQPQPILSRPEVTRGSQGLGTLVLFGAGGAPMMNNSPEGQTLYAIADHDQQVDRRNLQMLAIREGVDADSGGPVRFIASATPWSVDGWHLDLPDSPGSSFERLVTVPQLRNSKVIFRTQALSIDRTCSLATTWTWMLNTLSSRTRQPDEVVATISQEVFEGHTRRLAILQGISNGHCIQRVYPPRIEQNERPIGLSCEAGDTGRQSWRQLR